ncbi:MAG: hypothetical protein ACJAVN_002364 [Roseivirga sp.]|jgi:hypothetical protein
MRTKIFSTILLTLVLLLESHAQEFPLTSEIWEVRGAGHVFEPFMGKQSLYLYNGQARLKEDASFETGVLEYDVYVTDRRGFPGIQFRIADDSNYEEFYIRPHQSGNPDANQYTPVFNGLAGWQLYYGDGYAAPVTYKMNAWNHVKLVIAKTDGEVYINNMDEPVLYIPELKRKPISGSIRFNGGGPSPFHVAELKVTKMNDPPLRSKRIAQTELDETVIQSWSVSNSFPDHLVNDVHQLGKTQKEGLEWISIASEYPGYTNLARVAKIGPQRNTTFAKVTITSDRKQVKKLTYGFSDRVRIYLNDAILAGGNDRFTSRDYRFLGTMGYFDDVYLYLEKGKNELWMAVSEGFGGWGVMAKFDNKEGIKID